MLVVSSRHGKGLMPEVVVDLGDSEWAIDQ